MPYDCRLDKRKTHRKVAGNNNSMRLGVMNKFITVVGLLYHNPFLLSMRDFYKKFNNDLAGAFCAGKDSYEFT